MLFESLVFTNPIGFAFILSKLIRRDLELLIPDNIYSSAHNLNFQLFTISIFLKIGKSHCGDLSWIKPKRSG